MRKKSPNCLRERLGGDNLVGLIMVPGQGFCLGSGVRWA